MNEAMPEAIALPRGNHGYELTGLARGPWQPDAAHGGAPAALIARAAEQHGAGDGMRLASLSLIFFGPVMLGEVQLESEVVKPGRRQKVIAVRLTSEGRVAMEGHAVLLRQADVPLPDTIRAVDPEIPPPEAGEPVNSSLWAEGEGIAFHRTANSVMRIQGGPEFVGPTGTGWFRLDHRLVPDEELSPAQRTAAAADFGNGLAHPVAFGEYLFVNCDLNFATFRDPVGEWIGLVSRTDVDRVGSGLTTTELHDRQGRFGSATQSLYIDRITG